MKQCIILKERNKSMTSPSKVFDNIKKIDINYDQENAVLLCMNTKNELIHSEVIFKGGLNSCILDPKVIFRIALLHNSNSIIMAHNHPSGCLEPSQEDEEIDKRLKKLGEFLSLRMLDSIIFNKKEYYCIP